MTIVQHQTSLQVWRRLWHLPHILLYCLFLSQEMSLNIDIDRILPVKVSDVSPNLLSRSVTLPQSWNVVNPVREVWTSYASLLPFAEVRRLCCTAQGASGRKVEEDGEGQVEVEREEVEVKERRSCVKMGWNENSRTS